MTNNAAPTCLGNKFNGKAKPGTGGLSKGLSGSNGYGAAIGPTINPNCQAKVKP